MPKKYKVAPYSPSIRRGFDWWTYGGGGGDSPKVVMPISTKPPSPKRKRVVRKSSPKRVVRKSSPKRVVRKSSPLFRKKITVNKKKISSSPKKRR